MIVIYCYTNIKNRMQYVGQTDDLERRDRQHRTNSGDTYFDRAYSKHPEDFKLNIVRAFHDDASANFINDQEIYFISKFNSKYPNGYNLTEGGGGVRGYKDTEETKQKKREIKTKWWEEHPEKKEEFSILKTGVKPSEETRRKQSEAHKGNRPSEESKRKNSESQKKRYKNNPVSEETRRKISEANMGHEVSEETRKKQSEAAKRRPPITEEARNNMSKARMGNHNAIRKQVRLKKYNMIFDSISDAVKWIRENTKWKNAAAISISRCCNGLQKTAYGFEWEFINSSKEG